MKRIISIAAIAITLLVACDKEKTTPVEPVVPVEPQEPETVTINPSGIVLLSTPEQVVAGDTVAVRLRVNPSTARFTAENLALDCISSQVYEAQYTDMEKTYLGEDPATKSDDANKGVSYVRNAENFSVAGVVADTLNNETLAGQYIVLLKAQSEKNIFDYSSLALVYSFEDENGETACVSSETFSLTQIPQPADAIFAWAPQALSLHAGTLKAAGDSTFTMANDCMNPVKWYLLARTYKDASTGSTIQYDFAKYVSDTKVLLEKDSTEMACEQGKDDFSGAYSGVITEMRYATPDISQEPFKTLFEQGSDNKYETFTNKLTVTDKYGHIGEWSQPLNYVIPLQITYTLDLPEDVPVGTYELTDKFATLAEYGIDAEIIKRYPVQNLTTLKAINNHGLNIFFIPETRKDGFGIGSVKVVAGSDSSIKADVLCSRMLAGWLVKGPGEAKSGPLVNFLSIIERFQPAK